jgi:hypothetical protein
MPAKKKKPTRAKREYDMDNQVLRMTDKTGKDYEYSFNGIRGDVFLKLAMIGAGSILAKHTSPLIVWDKIVVNKFGRERDYSRIPKNVKAYAQVESLPIEKAIKQYKEMSTVERKELRGRSDIRKQLLRMQIDEIE